MKTTYYIITRVTTANHLKGEIVSKTRSLEKAKALQTKNPRIYSVALAEAGHKKGEVLKATMTII